MDEQKPLLTATSKPLLATAASQVEEKEAEQNEEEDGGPSEYDAHEITNREDSCCFSMFRWPCVCWFFLCLMVGTLVSWIFRWLFCWTVLCDKNRVFIRMLGRLFLVWIPTVLQPLWGAKRLGQLTNPELPKRCVIVCNHQSFKDAFTIERTLGIDMSYLVMKAVRDYPIFGSVLEGLGVVWVGFKTNQEKCDGFECTSRDTSLQEVKDALDRGQKVLIFPEGWLSRTGRLNHFKDGAFECAIDTNAHILPIALAGGQLAWPPDGYPTWGTQYLKVGELISTEGATREDMERLKQESRDAIKKLRQEMFQELDWKSSSIDSKSD